MILAVLRVPFTSFELPAEIIVLGLVTGLTYAVLGIGLTLVYKSSRVLNFAHGEIGALGAKIVPVLIFNNNMSYWPALLVALAATAAAGAVIEFGLIRRLAHAPRLIVLVATIGAAQVFFALALFIPQVSERARQLYPTPFHANVTIGNLRLGSGQLLILAVVPLVAIGLTLFLRMTRVGLASRAAAENLEAAELAGVPTGRVSMVIWIAAGLLAGLSAILIGPTRPISTVGTQVALGPILMLRALAAAMIGGLTSFPVVFAGGVAIGLVEALVSWNYPTGGFLELILFAVILASLLVRRGLGQLARGGEESSWSLTGALATLDPRTMSMATVERFRRIGMLTLLAVVTLLPLAMTNANRVRASTVLIFIMMSLSVVVLTGLAGQVSLGQFAFVALGALVGGRVAQLGYPPWMGLVYAVAAGGLAALVIGLPALRIRGLFLAVTTLGFAVASSTWLFAQRWLVNTGSARTSLSIPRPEWLGIDFQKELNYYWLCLVALVGLAAIVHRTKQTGIGRAFMAVRDNEPQAATLTVDPRRAKLLAFVLAGMIAAFAGYFYGGLLVNFPDLTIFGPDKSLELLAMGIIGGVTSVTGAVLGALFVKGVPIFVNPTLGELLGPKVQLLLSGVGLVVVLLQFPGGLAGEAFRLRQKLVQRLTGRVAEPTDVRRAVAPRAHLEPAPQQLPEAVGEEAASVPIEARDIVVRFGGNLALDRVSVHATQGEIVGLLGPNGAGKTTLFEVLSGHLAPTSGQVLLHGQDITVSRPAERAREGIGRSFQQAKLFTEMPLIDTFKVALERHEPSELVPSLLSLPPSWRSEQHKDLRAHELVDLLGLGDYAYRNLSELSTGVRRMVELGCMVALGAEVLLLDEPTAGIAQREVEAFGPMLREIRDHLAATMIVIDHDVPMMLALAERVYVLSAGRVIAEGPPHQVRDDPGVIGAFLGTDERAIQRSGPLVAVLPDSEHVLGGS